MSPPLPLIHIGFHKTASSLLQARLFTEAKLGFQTLGNDRQRIVEAFILQGGLGEPDAAQTDSLRKEAGHAADAGLSLVISHERLSGYPASGGFDQGLIAERLHKVFPDAKILMLIREQKSMIYSMYLQTISDGGTLSARRYLNPPEEKELLRKPGFRFDFYEYDRAIRKYQALFGTDNVKVVAFEQLRKDSDALARDLITFVSGPEKAAFFKKGSLREQINKGRPLAFQAIRRRINMLTRNQLCENGLVTMPVRYVDKLVRMSRPALEVFRPLDSPLKKHLQAQIARACEGRYAESNRQVAELTGLDLESFGYDFDSGPSPKAKAKGIA